jgi:hypothetical protein
LEFGVVTDVGAVVVGDEHQAFERYFEAAVWLELAFAVAEVEAVLLD